MKTKIALFSVAAMLLVACGDSSEGSTPGVDAPNTTTTSAETPVTTQPLGSGPYPVATLDVVITHPNAEDIVFTISCLGDTATIIGEAEVNEMAACSNLAFDAVRTRLVDGAPLDQACDERYGGPDVAHIVGTYDGVAVDTTVDRSNGCGIADWDQLLSGVLPTAMGITE